MIALIVPYGICIIHVLCCVYRYCVVIEMILFWDHDAFVLLVWCYCVDMINCFTLYFYWCCIDCIMLVYERNRVTINSVLWLCLLYVMYIHVVCILISCWSSVFIIVRLHLDCHVLYGFPIFQVCIYIQYCSVVVLVFDWDCIDICLLMYFDCMCIVLL